MSQATTSTACAVAGRNVLRPDVFLPEISRALEIIRAVTTTIFRSIGGGFNFSAWRPTASTTGIAQLVLCVSRCSRERDRVAYVGEAGHIGERALEAEAKARVRHGAIAAQIAVPAVILLVEADLGDALVEYVESLLALAAADDLADPGADGRNERRSSYLHVDRSH